MLEDAVPCVNATDWELRQGKHHTREEDGHCMRCQSILGIFLDSTEVNGRLDAELVDN